MRLSKLLTAAQIENSFAINRTDAMASEDAIDEDLVVEGNSQWLQDTFEV